MQNKRLQRCVKGFVLTAVVAGFLAGTNAMATDPPGTDGTPSGMVAFFTTTSCPPGWNVATNVQGRAVVAVQNSSDLGVTVGTPLQDKTAPGHIHSYKTDITLPTKHAALATGGSDDRYAKSGKYTISGDMQEATSDLPFIQLVVCQKE
ncbi:hypothetical protein [Candidatus Nitrospira allomarina]|uniref:Lipoprotein n=1 Tax=Candidatus Nitrospira allomarina TaxID=3020900 RepID=A0AA96JZZ5_9BACT|nr:hypothetical protein [Candidatus Nitrospira allomarina]WNM59189.1 hypothetical protein PP769_05335 [Candidatus Nitrospira allomarina]